MKAAFVVSFVVLGAIATRTNAEICLSACNWPCGHNGGVLPVVLDPGAGITTRRIDVGADWRDLQDVFGFASGVFNITVVDPLNAGTMTFVDASESGGPGAGQTGRHADFMQVAGGFADAPGGTIVDPSTILITNQVFGGIVVDALAPGLNGGVGNTDQPVAFFAFDLITFDATPRLIELRFDAVGDFGLFVGDDPMGIFDATPVQTDSAHFFVQVTPAPSVLSVFVWPMLLRRRR